MLSTFGLFSKYVKQVKTSLKQSELCKYLKYDIKQNSLRFRNSISVSEHIEEFRDNV